MARRERSQTQAPDLQQLIKEYKGDHRQELDSLLKKREAAWTALDKARPDHSRPHGWEQPDTTEEEEAIVEIEESIRRIVDPQFAS
jgi:hypothetical protein